MWSSYKETKKILSKVAKDNNISFKEAQEIIESVFEEVKDHMQKAIDREDLSQMPVMYIMKLGTFIPYHRKATIVREIYKNKKLKNDSISGSANSNEKQERENRDPDNEHTS